MRSRLHASAIGALLLTLVAVGPGGIDAPVAEAASRGDREAVRELLKNGEDVNVAQGDGMTALHWAGQIGDAEMAQMLLYAGADIEAVTRLGNYTPLLVAAEAGNASVVKVLLDAGADVSVRTTSGGSTALHLAAAAGSADAVEALLDHGADVNVRQTAWGQTPLMYAADKNRVEAMRVLIAHGADLTLTSHVLDLARRAAQDRKAGAIRDSVLAEFRAHSPDPVLWHPNPTEVQAAVRAARPYEILADKKAPRIDWDSAQMAGKIPSYADLVGYQGGLTALLHAVREGHSEAVMTLLDAGADINEVSDGDHTSPLLMAMVNGYFDLGLELLARGADPKIASDAGATPLYAVINQRWTPKARYPQQEAYQQQKATHLETMKALLDAGADPNVRLKKHLWYMEYTFSQLGIDTWGATPFWRAAQGLDVDAMKLLVSYGADPNIPTRVPPKPPTYAGKGFDDVSGLPPIPVGGPGVYPIDVAAGDGGTGAARAGNSQNHVPDGWLPAVKYLVEELHADPNQRDFIGYTPLHNAAGRGLNDVIKYLVSKGADPKAIARTGQTTVDMANGPAEGVAPFLDTMQLLESMGAVNNHTCIYCQ